MNSSTYVRTNSAATRVGDRAPEATGGGRLADYIVDVFFIALLAAPFLIFESPASVQDAAAPAHTSVVAATPALSAAQDAAYGPE